jgi:hypothetical protein
MGAYDVVEVDSTEFWLGVLPAGRPEFWAARGRTSGLWLTVDAPGELYVSEAVHLRLRGGTIQDLVPITLVRHWEPWKRAGVDAIARILEQRRLSDIETRFGGRDSMVEMVADLIGRILDGMVTARHGGALVILPREGLNCIDLRWPVRNLNLAATAADYWEACMKASDSLTEQTVRDYLVRRDHLLHLVRSVTQLTEADGCVVLSPELEVVGFGGEITVDDRTAACSAIVFSDLDSARAWPDQSGHDLGGTRHRSAYRLCKTVPGALVFVVSQDGDLTLLYSTHDNVHAIRGLTARHGITWRRGVPVGWPTSARTPSGLSHGPFVRHISALPQVPKITRVPVDGMTSFLGIAWCTAMIVFTPVQCMGMT